MPRLTSRDGPASLSRPMSQYNPSVRRYPFPIRPLPSPAVSMRNFNRINYARPITPNAVRQRVGQVVNQNPKINHFASKNTTLHSNNTHFDVKDDLMKNIMKLKQDFGDKNITEKILSMVKNEENNLIKDYLKKKSKLTEIRSLFLKDNKKIVEPVLKKNQTVSNKLIKDISLNLNSTQMNEISKLNSTFQISNSTNTTKY